MEALPLRTALRCIFPPFLKYNTHLTHLPLCEALSQQHLQSRSDITLALMLITAPAAPADFSTTCLKPQSSAHHSFIQAILFLFFFLSQISFLNYCTVRIYKEYLQHDLGGSSVNMRMGIHKAGTGSKDSAPSWPGLLKTEALTRG